MPETGLFERNLRALKRTSPAACARILSASPAPEASFELAGDAALAVSLAGRWLTSRRAPLVEASRLADTVPVAEAGIVVALGFGAGYHIAQLAERMGRRGLIVCFEPNVGLLRAVLERVD